jgi:tetratricopeptide (TPR) repeat protein
MPYNGQYFIDINIIIADIDNGQIIGPGQAITKFQTFVSQVKNIGRYSIIDWPSQFLNRVYEFGNKFKIIDPTLFLTALENEINISSFAEKEILYFLKSEILWNFESHLKQENFLIGLVNQYITNAELLHNLGHIKLEKELYIEAIENYSQAIRINSTNTFLDSKWQAEVKYVEHLIEIEKYDTAENLINDCLNSKIYQSNFIQQNWLVFLANRIKDYKLQDIKFQKKEIELIKLMNDEFQSERRKVIELLGLFTAIIAFIFTNVSVAKNFEYTQAINFTTCLGLVLIDFAITISIIFHNKSIPIYKDIRLYVALIVTLFLFLILSTTTLINEFLKHIHN